MMISTSSSSETSATSFKVSPNKTYSWLLLSDDLFFSLISVALLFHLLFRGGRCPALTEEISIDISAVVCMVSLMTLVVLFANGVDTDIGSIADGSVVAV